MCFLRFNTRYKLLHYKFFPVDCCRRKIKILKIEYNRSMYEVTVSALRKEQHLLEHIKREAVPAIAEMDGIFTEMSDESRSYFSAACSDTYRFQLRRLLSGSIAETIALGYKNIFVRNCLHVNKGNFLQNVLINTMCVFDKTYDQQIVSKIIDVDKPVFIDGYCNFRLQPLKKKWKEIANLVAENNYILQDKQLILEFLQYLLESVYSRAEQLTVTLDKDTFMLYDGQGKVLTSCSTLAQNPTVEEEAAVNVLLLKPAKLNVYFDKQPSEDFCTVMQMFRCRFVQTQ